MCRNIKTLYHFVPPATPDEMRASALQYVRKLSGMRAPSRANRAAFERAVEAVFSATVRLINSLEAQGAPRTREEERIKAVERGRKREQKLRAELTFRKGKGKGTRTGVDEKPQPAPKTSKPSPRNSANR